MTDAARRIVCIVLIYIFAQNTAVLLNASLRQRSIATVDISELPREARQTIALIKKGGPYPYRKDGALFGNFERRLPLHERGYYREFTVPSPGARNRGARRIIQGKAGEFYYTDDHYQTFRLVRE
jgi:ribonuclease T1